MSKMKRTGKCGKPLGDPPSAPRGAKVMETRSGKTASQDKMASESSKSSSKQIEDDMTTTMGLSVIPPMHNAHRPKRVVCIPKKLQETPDELGPRPRTKSATRSKDSQMHLQESSQSKSSSQRSHSGHDQEGYHSPDKQRYTGDDESTS